MLEELLPLDIINMLDNVVNIADIDEIRLRRDMPIRYMASGKYDYLRCDNETIIATKSDIDYVLATATHRSMYAFNEQIANGYIVFKGGIRIGIAGVGVRESSKITTFKDISSLIIRVPHEIRNIAKSVHDVTQSFDINLLIVSRPCGGKTTLLRDYVRMASNSGYNVLLVDERGEVAAVTNGKNTLDVGCNTDIITSTIKDYAYRIAVRSLSPDIIATDEVFGQVEAESIIDVMRSGVKVVATIHGGGVEEIMRGEYGIMARLFDYIALITMEGCERKINVVRVNNHE